jgi:hypothetical protein
VKRHRVLKRGHFSMIAAQPDRRSRTEARMLHGALRTLVKIALASLVVGTIMAHFGVTPQQVVDATGLSAPRVEELARQGRAGASSAPYTLLFYRVSGRRTGSHFAWKRSI